MVCTKDYDIKPQEMTPPKVTAEGTPKRDSRPDNSDIDAANNTTAGDL